MTLSGPRGVLQQSEEDIELWTNSTWDGRGGEESAETLRGMMQECPLEWGQDNALTATSTWLLGGKRAHGYDTHHDTVV